MDIEAPIVNLISAGLTDANIAIGLAADKILTVNLRLELYGCLAFSRTVVVIAAATCDQRQRDA